MGGKEKGERRKEKGFRGKGEKETGKEKWLKKMKRKVKK